MKMQLMAATKNQEAPPKDKTDMVVKTDQNPQTSFLVHLPEELIVHVGDFLPITDLSSFSCCSKPIHNMFPWMKSCHPSELIPAKSKFYGHIDDQRREGPVLQVAPNTRRIVVKTLWRDQGWGYRKGFLYIVAFDSCSQDSDKKDFSRGRIVQTSPLVDHVAQHLKIEFTPRRGETYFVWLYVGDGGGHQLIFDNPLVMYSVVGPP